MKIPYFSFISVGDDTHRGISGGEKKRLSIGCEMIADPRCHATLPTRHSNSFTFSIDLILSLFFLMIFVSLLFLDEPTTGLDGTRSL
jgi:hypothetical protein